MTLPVVGTIVAGDAGNGLCGGFVLAALDLFRHNPRLLPPPNTEVDRPPAGSPIFNYIVGRLLDSFACPTLAFPMGNAARVIEWIHTPGHDVLLSFYGWGLARRVVQGEWPKIKADIDSGVPSPLNLVMGPERHAVDITGHIATLHNCHQVLAYAYEVEYEVDNAQNLTILVYDCNDPTNDDSRISLNIGSNPYNTIPIAAPAVSAALAGGPTVRGFFRTNYDLHDPSVIVAGWWSGWAGLGGGVTEIAAAVNSDGRIEVFAIGTDTALHHIWQTSPGGGWSGWAGLDGGVTEIAAAVNSDGRIEVFAIGTDKALNHIWQTSSGGGWSGWAGLGGGVTEIAAAVNSDDRIEVFAIGTDKALHHIWQIVRGG